MKHKFFYIVFLFVIISFGYVLESEESIEHTIKSKEIKFKWKSEIKYPGNVILGASVESPFYKLVVGFKIPNIHIYQSINDFYLESNALGFRFSPIVFSENSNHFDPVLSFFTGKILKSKSFQKLYSTSLNNITEKYRGIGFPKIGHFDLSSRSLGTDFGIEVAVKNIGFNFIIEPSKNKNSIDCAGMFLWQHEWNSKYKDKLFVAGLIGIASANDRILLLSDKHKFNITYGGILNYSNSFLSLESDGFGCFLHNTNQGYSFSFKLDSFYKIFGFKSGISYSSQNYLGWKNTKPKNNFYVFINSEFKYNIFSLVTSYSCRYKKGIPLHSFGGQVKVVSDYFDYKLGLRYSSNIFTPTTSIKILSPQIKWFNYFLLGFKSDMENKKLNPYIIQKYAVNSELEFQITENIILGCNTKITQKNVRKNIKDYTGYKKIIEWQKLKYNTALKFEFKRKHKINTHKFSFGVNIMNIKPFYKMSVTYRVN